MKPEVVVSTDILGMFGRIRDIEKIYGPKYKKLELIGWNLTLDRHIKEAEELGYEISSIHGQVTSLNAPIYLSEKIYLMLINLILKPTPVLLNYGRKYDLLFHVGNINLSNLIAIISNKNNLSKIWIENEHWGIKSIERVMQIVNRLRTDGVNAGITFDLAHFIGTKNLLSNNFDYFWKETLRLIEMKLFNARDHKNNLIPLSLHFPVGPNMADALPIENKLTIDMLKDFSQLLKFNRIERLIIENQQINIKDKFYLNSNRINSLKKRNDMIIEKLAKVGII